MVRSKHHQVLGKRPVGGHQRLHAHRRGDVGRTHQHVEIGERQHEHAEHAVGPVDQRQTLLGPQRDRGDSRGSHRLGTFAFTDQCQGDVRQRSQIAAGTQRPVLVDRRRDVGVEQGEDGVDDDLTHAGEAHRQGTRPQQHHRPHHFRLDQRAHSGGVGADQGALQFLASLRRDHRGRQRAEAGRDAVYGIVALRQALDDGRAACDGVGRRRGQPHRGTAAGDSHHILGAHTVRADEDFACRDFHRAVTYTT